MGGKLSKYAVLIWRIRMTLFAFAAFFMAGVAAVFYLPVAIILAALFLAAYIAALFFYCPMLYKVQNYRLQKGEIHLEKGLVLHHSIDLNISAIRYVESLQGPLQRRFHACTIVFHTVGKNVRIEPLDLNDGLRLKSELERKHNP